MHNIQKLVRKSKLDLLLLTSTANIRYVLDRYDYAYGGIVCIPKNKEPFMISSVAEKSTLEDVGMEILSVSKKLEADIKEKSKVAALKKILAERKISKKSIGLEMANIDANSYNKIRKKLKARYTDFSGFLYDLRSVKSGAEIAVMKKGAAITVKGFKAVSESVRPGITEREIARIFESEVRKKSDWYSFDTIVAAGKNAAYPHGAPSDRVIKPTDLIVVDAGIIYKNYHTDMTRTFCMKPGGREKMMFNMVLDAHKLAIDSARVGMRAGALDFVARDYFNRCGFGEFFTHSLGHGVGIEVHEAPSVSQESSEKMKAGMIFTVEPGLYIKGFGGVRIEDMVLLTKNGKKVLTNFPRVL